MSHEKMDRHHVKVMSQYNAQCFAIRDALKKKGFINSNVTTAVSSQGKLPVRYDFWYCRQQVSYNIYFLLLERLNDYDYEMIMSTESICSIQWTFCLLQQSFLSNSRFVMQYICCLYQPFVLFYNRFWSLSKQVLSEIVNLLQKQIFVVKKNYTFILQPELFTLNRSPH